MTDDTAIGMAPQGKFPPNLSTEGWVIPVATWVNNARSREAEKLYLEISVDLARGVMTRFEDRLPTQRPPALDFFQSEKAQSALKPLVIEQPAGPSFEIRGSKLRWQNWEMYLSVNPRRGLDLYDVAYRDGDRLRTVLYRA